MDAETVSRSEAVDRLLDLRDDLRVGGVTERVPLDRAAGRTVAAEVRAPGDVPARGFATMDGYAVPADAGDPLAVVGEVGPEDDPPDLDPGETVRIATGAPLPDRADAVLMREDASVEDGRVDGPALDPGTNVYPAGATASEGETLFAAGDRIAPRHAALLRDVGIDEVPVVERVEVAVIATGTEIHEGRQPDRDSEMVCNLVRSWGGRPEIAGTVPDDRDRVERAIREAAADADAVITSGGTSVGRVDHVTDVLSDGDLLFPGVDLRPGRPVTAAVYDGTPVLALPGKPLAAHTAATLVGRALFAGADPLATVTADPTARVGLPDDDLEYAVPVVLDDGRAIPLGHASSGLDLYEDRFRPGRVSSSTRATLADGVALVTEPLVPGDPVDVVPHGVVE